MAKVNNIEAEVDASLDNGYEAMAADRKRETEAAEWCNALIEDMR